MKSKGLFNTILNGPFLFRKLLIDLPDEKRNRLCYNGR